MPKGAGLTTHQRRKGGQKSTRKGVPNRVSADLRAKFFDMIEQNADKVQEWLIEVANGIKAKGPDGKPVAGDLPEDYLVLPNPGKAIDLLCKMGGFVLPQLKQVTIDDQTKKDSVSQIKIITGKETIEEAKVISTDND